MDIVKQHFEEEANEYDQIIIRLIPYYPQMLKALIKAIPFCSDESFKVIDLGCGTGTISRLVKTSFPNARITCLDIAENMIKIAKHKLAGESGIEYLIGDFNQFEFDGSYDVMVSSLALHHLLTDDDKIRFYKKMYRALNRGGVFYNADVVLGSNDHLQQVYLQEWKTYMRKQVSDDEIETKWLVNYYREDRPVKITDHFGWLANIGFIDIDVLWKYFNYAVYGGKKA